MEQHKAALGLVSSTERKSLDKAAETTRAATEIIERAALASARKTERLRAARLARDEAAPPPVKAPRKRAASAVKH
ncbi:MAG: hypothetical protein DI629_05775 [Mesorhizobium amorphae]|nr:MAG: hypothetical protein DI629_05775 [Mesorhizobium amorphae]